MIAPVTIIVPCFNEEAGLPSLLARLRGLLEHPSAQGWEVLFVDDGSTDGTFSALLAAARDESWIRVVRQHENLGLGAALRTGFLHTDSPVICTIDCGCTYPPERLPELAALVRAGAAVATASVWHPDSVGGEGNALRLGLSRAVSRIYKVPIQQDVHTFTCLFRAYEGDLVRQLRFRADGFASVAEIMLRLMFRGRRIESHHPPCALKCRCRWRAASLASRS